MKSYISCLFKFLGLALIKYATLHYLRLKLIDYHKFNRDLELLKNLPEASASKLIKLLDLSKSQLRQDLFVIAMCDFKVDGFFVEFGATNGITLSNTYLLEKQFGCNGILAEPANIWKGDLINNRTSFIESKCVWSNSGSTINFIETSDPELSTISSFDDWYIKS